MGRMFEVLLLDPEAWVLFQRRVPCDCLSGKLTWVHLAGIFSKMNKVSLTLQENKLTVFVTNDKLQAFSQNFGFGETGICHHELDHFPKTRRHLLRWDQRDFNKWDFLKNVLYSFLYSFLEDLHNSVSQYFPIDQCMMLHNYAPVKDPFK